MRLEPFYIHRTDWGYTVRFDDVYPFRNSFSTEEEEKASVDEVLEWINENSQARRIGYDIWQFSSKSDADQFLMIYNLRWP